MFRIEDVYNITKRVEYVDGQRAFFIDKNMKKEIRNAKDYINSNYDRGIIQNLSYDINFMLEHEGFAEIFRPMHFVEKEMWIPCLVFYYQNEWRKVVIQNIYCKDCGWKGRIACPVETELFLGMKDRQERLEMAFGLHFLGCPECGGKLSNYAIWIEA